MRKRSWSKRDEPAQSTSEAEIHQKKVMLSVWLDFKGIVYFEQLPRNQTVNSNVYCHQLMKLDKEIKKKRPELENRKGVIFHQDNTRPHISLVTRKKLLELGRKVMPHPPYSPDLSPSDRFWGYLIALIPDTFGPSQFDLPTNCFSSWYSNDPGQLSVNSLFTRSCRNSCKISAIPSLIVRNIFCFSPAKCIHLFNHFLNSNQAPPLPPTLFQTFLRTYFYSNHFPPYY